MAQKFALSTLGGLLLGSFIALPAAAESGLYLGASVGNAKVGGPNDLEFAVDNDDIRNLDDSDIGYKVFGGFKFTMLAVEAGYVDFGVIEEGDASVEVGGFNAFGILSMGLGPVEIFGKAGAFVWESDYRDYSAAAARYEDDGFDPVVGLGAAITLGGLGVRAEYEYYDISEFDKVSMLSLGATFWFF